MGESYAALGINAARSTCIQPYEASNFDKHLQRVCRIGGRIASNRDAMPEACVHTSGMGDALCEERNLSPPRFYEHIVKHLNCKNYEKFCQNIR